MRIPQPGNGSGQFDVGVHDMAGWGGVIAGGTATQDGNLPFYLAHRLSHWHRETFHSNHGETFRYPIADSYPDRTKEKTSKVWDRA